MADAKQTTPKLQYWEAQLQLDNLRQKRSQMLKRWAEIELELDKLEQNLAANAEAIEAAEAEVAKMHKQLPKSERGSEDED